VMKCPSLASTAPQRRRNDVEMNLFSRKKDLAARLYRTAIIDIGSNSVRLVVYAGSRRNPAIIFNEKVMAGLGRDLDRTGAIAEESIERAVYAVERYQYLARQMQIDQMICVATAAVRDATNGQDFADRVKALGLDLEVIPGRDEAKIAAMGVISAIPSAKGIVGDLGGGSLDLARVENGQVCETATLPIGVLRLAVLRERHGRELQAKISQKLSEIEWLKRYQGEPFYLVGGSWRAVARFDMHLTGYPLRVLHHYQLSPDRPERLVEELASFDREALRDVSQLPNSRIDNLGDAASLLAVMSDHLQPSELIVSAYGLREGLLYHNMNDQVRRLDPLLVAAQLFGQDQSRFGEDGIAIYQWLSHVFQNDPPEWRRWFKAACHLADVGWQANPDFRAERGLEMALHGNWVGIDAAGRMMIAQALFTSFGGGAKPYPLEHDLISADMIERAIAWGLGIRLAQRLTGGTRALLDDSRLDIVDGVLQLRLPASDDAAQGEVVERRLRRFALALDTDFETVIG